MIAWFGDIVTSVRKVVAFEEWKLTMGFDMLASNARVLTVSHSAEGV